MNNPCFIIKDLFKNSVGYLNQSMNIKKLINDSGNNHPHNEARGLNVTLSIKIVLLYFLKYINYISYVKLPLKLLKMMRL